MKFLANITSFFTMIVGLVLNALSRFTDIIDDSAATVTAMLALIGAFVWLSISIIKKKQAKISLENEMLENEIKKRQLENLNKTEI